MAKIYDEKEIEDLERQATLKQRQDAAMKILNQEKPDPYELAREKWHQANMNARIRFNDSHAMSLVNDPGRANPQAVRAAERWLEGRGYGQEGERRRQFDVTNETERIKAREHANGLINQGKTQAEIKAAAELETSRNKDGWWDDQGNFHPGASFKAAEATGQAKIGVEEKKNEGKVAVEDKKTERTRIVEGNKNQRSTEHNQTLENIANTQANANVEAARERQRKIDERRAQQDALAEQRDFEKFKKDINNLKNTQFSSEDRMKFNAMKPEEQKAFWKDYQGRQQEQQLPKVKGYTPKRVAELIKRGYKVVDGKFVK